MPTARATGLFVSLCTIQAHGGVFSDSGQAVPPYVPVTGLIDIPCMAAPTSEVRITADQKRTTEEIKDDDSSHVLLDDYYPTIETHWRAGAQAVLDGVTNTILGVEFDSQSRMTRLKLEVCTI